MDGEDETGREPVAADSMTRRQRLADLLSMESRSVEGLAAEFRCPPRDIEADLRSLERTLKRERKKLVVEPARCRKCLFVFDDRSDRRFTTPGKCPQCRATQIAPALLTIK